MNSLEVVSLRSVGKSVLVLSDKGPKVRRGILRFFGTVEFASGQFCGIELDTPQGKHNGSFKGIRYFQCTPEHGIFVPAEKVYNDPKSNFSKTKTLTSPPSVTINKGKLKKAQSDLHTYLSAPASSSRVKDVATSEEQNLNDTNLFQILSTVSNDDIKQTTKSPKFIPPPKISPKTMNTPKYPALLRPSSSSLTYSSIPDRIERRNTENPIVLVPRTKTSFPNRPKSVTSTNSRNTLALQVIPTHKKSLPLARHSSLTENDFKNIALSASIRKEIPTFVVNNKPIPQVEIPDLSIEIPKPVANNKPIPQVEIPELSIEIPKPVANNKPIPQVEIPELSIEIPKSVANNKPIPQVEIPELSIEIPKSVANNKPIPQVEIPELSIEISKSVANNKPISQVEIPELSIEIPEPIEVKESLLVRSSSLYEQQDTLTQSRIPEIPQCYDISVELNTFFESNQKFIKEANNAREIMQFIDKDKIEWDNRMHMLQERFRKLREDVEVLCYQHLEALSHLPSQKTEASLDNSNQETLFNQNSL